MDHQLAKHIIDLEVALLQPEIRRSAEKISALLADDFLEFGKFGNKYSKLDIVNLLPNSKEEAFERYSASDFEAREITTDTVLLTYKASTKYLKTNKTLVSLRCSIWQKRGTNWQMIFHQGTVIKDAISKDNS